jgi:hypothetical protein
VPEPAAPRPSPGAAPAPDAAASELPTRDQLTLAWADQILPRLKPGVKALFAAGRFSGVEGGAAVFAVPNPPHREKCEAKRSEVEDALAAHFGRRVPLRVVVDGPPPDEARAPARSRRAAGDPAPEPDEEIDLRALLDAPPDDRSPLDRISEAFPGSQLLEE